MKSSPHQLQQIASNRKKQSQSEFLINAFRYWITSLTNDNNQFTFNIPSNLVQNVPYHIPVPIHAITDIQSRAFCVRIDKDTVPTRGIVQNGDYKGEPGSVKYGFYVDQHNFAYFDLQKRMGNESFYLKYFRSFNSIITETHITFKQNQCPETLNFRLELDYPNFFFKITTGNDNNFVKPEQYPLLDASYEKSYACLFFIANTNASSNTENMTVQFVK
jgi:hypothetical protein